jgi:hypothetical protein
VFSPELTIKLVKWLGPPGINVRESLLGCPKGLFLLVMGRVLVLPEVEIFIMREILGPTVQIGVQKIPECPRVICSLCGHFRVFPLLLSKA